MLSRDLLQNMDIDLNQINNRGQNMMEPQDEQTRLAMLRLGQDSSRNETGMGPAQELSSTMPRILGHGDTSLA